jgi:hypothetical protein
MLPSHVRDRTTTHGCTDHGKVAQPLRSEHRGVVAS